MRRKLTVLTALVVLSAASAAEAQEIMLEGPLAGAPACRQCILYREGRFTVTPALTFTLLDDYRRHIFVGARLTYNITDWLGVSVAGGYGGFWGDLLDTGLTREVSEKAPNGIESNRANFPFAADSTGAEDAERLTTDLLGRLLGFVSAELVFTPLRGKFGLFSRLFLDVDLYIFAGYALPFVQERADVDCRTAELIEDRGYAGGRIPAQYGDRASYDGAIAERCPWIGASGVATASEVPRADPRLAVGAGTYGLGVSIYFNEWAALNVEYRVMPMLWNHTGTDERGMDLQDDVLTFCPSDAESGSGDYCGDTGTFPDHRVDENDRTWTVNHMFTVGATFHFPIRPRHSP